MNQQQEDIENLWNSLNLPLNDAITMMLSMREREGLKLEEDIITRCDYIKELINKVAERAPAISIQYKEKLEKRVRELLNDAKLDESRLAMEIAIFADKSNVDEEIVRLNSHIVQMSETLELAEPIGRKLDFIIQEMNRETNTIASKANDLELTNIVLNIKNEIEKIREQVQNVE